MMTSIYIRVNPQKNNIQMKISAQVINNPDNQEALLNTNDLVHLLANPPNRPGPVQAYRISSPQLICS